MVPENMRVLTVTLNPAVDKTVAIPHFSVGEDFRETALFMTAGGKGVNVSRVLRRLGVRNTACGLLGGPDGDRVRKMLDGERIESDFCRIKDNTRTSLTILDPSLNTITRVLERGPWVTRRELETFRKRFRYLLRASQYVVLAGRNAQGVPDSLYGELIDEANRRGLFTIFDTSGRPFRLGLGRRPFMIKPNLNEAGQLMGRIDRSLSEVKRTARDLRRRGVQIVAITMGSRGAVVFDGREMIVARPPRIKRRSPVGCGDAFIGGFVAARLRRRNFEACVRMAVACGTTNAMSINPGFVKMSTIRSISKRIKIYRETFRAA